MRQKFAPLYPSFPKALLKMVACGKCNYALCDLRKFSLHTFRLGQLQVALVAVVRVAVAVAKRVNDMGETGTGRHCTTVGGAVVGGWACPANVAKISLKFM